ncbi:pentatricopeptide repeat-containing protein At2g18940, chloroplastic-like [Humulus lupulus]|uniref:pentatricopeptide repeat-containing protein At2g18940, chloroplastic-like n=1 Tax=Humulus lupulus TaxID=3486 RepID=UPI002B40989F|nr:pentatricopeptide repeat-containing protein At2g18940, chloroplastic-like [Humulus lupulus]
MEGSLFPSRPVYPTPSNKPTQPNFPPWKLNPTTAQPPPPPPPPTQSPSPSSFPIDSLLQHLLHLSSSPKTPHTVKPVKPHHFSNAHLRSLKLSVDSTQKQLENGGYEKPTSVLVSQLEEDEEEGRLETGFLEFLTTKDIIECLYCVDDIEIVGGGWQKETSKF